MVTSSHAVGTRTFDLDTIQKLSGGDLEGVAVSSDGVVRAGLTLGNFRCPTQLPSFARCHSRMEAFS